MRITIGIAAMLALRLYAAMTMPLPPQADAAAYDGLATRFAQTGALLDAAGSPEVYRPPGYPVFAGAVYALGGGPRAVGCVQAVLDVGSAAVLYVMAGPIAAALYAVSPAAIFAAGSLLSECVGTLLLMLSVFFAWKQRPVVAGVCAGVGTLTRSFMIGFPLALIPLLRRKSAAMLGVYACVLGVWMLRNGAPMLTANSGVTLYSSWVIKPGHVWGNVVDDDTMREAVTHSPREADGILRASAWAYVKADPLRALALLPIKLTYLFAPVDWELAGRGGRFYNPWWPLVVVLAAWSWTLTPPASRQTIALGFAYLVCVSMMFYGSPRFRAPFEPLLLLAVRRRA